MDSFFTELKRRNVFKIAVAYAIVAWLIAQIIAVVDGPLNLPSWFDTAIIVLLLVGFPLALLFAWAFELTAEGIKSSKSVAPAVHALTFSVHQHAVGRDNVLKDMTESYESMTAGCGHPSPLPMADLADVGAGVDFHDFSRRPGGDFQSAHDRDPGDAQQR